MLTQIVGGDVQQLYRVESAAPVIRVDGSMSSHTVIMKLYRTHGGGPALHHRVEMIWMPADHHVCPLKEPGADHQRLSQQDLFRGCTKQANGPGLTCQCQHILHRQSCRQGTGAQQVVRAAVTWSALYSGVLSNVHHLRQSLQCVILRTKADHGASGTILRHECRLDPTSFSSHMKSFSFQHIAQQLSGFLLLKGDLRVFPYPFRDIAQLPRPLFNAFRNRHRSARLSNVL